MLPSVRDIADDDLDTVWAKLQWAYDTIQAALDFTCERYGMPRPEVSLSWFQVNITKPEPYTTVSCYSHDRHMILISIRDIWSVWGIIHDGLEITDEHIIWFVTAHEATHHWQWARGDMATSDPTGHETMHDYQQHNAKWFEREANEIAVAVLAARFDLHIELS